MINKELYDVYDKFGNIKKQERAKIDEAGQITILKAALISDRAYICSANVIKTMPMDNDFINMAKQQLAQEYPEIFGEEMK